MIFLGYFCGCRTGGLFLQLVRTRVRMLRFSSANGPAQATRVGRLIAFHLTPGEAADCKSYDTLIDLPEQAPKALLADKAYDTDAIRDDLKNRAIKPVIPPKSNRA